MRSVPVHAKPENNALFLPACVAFAVNPAESCNAAALRDVFIDILTYATKFRMPESL